MILKLSKRIIYVKEAGNPARECIIRRTTTLPGIFANMAKYSLRIGIRRKLN